jgi:hypothetical protein
MRTAALLALAVAAVASGPAEAQAKPEAAPKSSNEPRCYPITPATLSNCQPKAPWPKPNRVKGGPVVVVLDSGMG